MKTHCAENIKTELKGDFKYSNSEKILNNKTSIMKPSWQLRCMRIFCRLFIQTYILIAFISPFLEQNVVRNVLLVLEFIVAKLRRFPVRRSKEYIEGTRIYWFTPNNVLDDSKIIVYVHGGGFFFGSPYTHGIFARKLATKTGLKVCFIDYELGPKLQCPKTVEHISRVYEHIILSGTSAENVMFGGDSSGANQILVLLQKLVSSGKGMPKAVFLESPFTDVSLESPSVHENWKVDCMLPFPPFLIGYSVKRLGNLYGGGRAVSDPEISPINESCNGLPPMFVSYGNHESLRDDSIRLIKKARDAGVSVEAYSFNMTPHGNLLFCGFYPEADESLDNLMGFIYSQFKLNGLDDG